MKRMYSPEEVDAMIEEFIKSIGGYDETKVQTLQHTNSGSLKWVDNE